MKTEDKLAYDGLSAFRCGAFDFRHRFRLRDNLFRRGIRKRLSWCAGWIAACFGYA